MTPRVITMIALLVLSEGVGIALGEWFFRLFLRAVPPVALSDFNTQSSRIAHLIYGAGVGLVLWLWALMGMASGSMLRSMSKSASKS